MVEAGDRDEHEGTGGPDVQVVRGDDEGGGGDGGGRDPEFAPECVDVGLRVVDAGVFHHVVACCGVGAVGADEEVEIYGDFGVSFGGGLICSFGTLLFEPGCLLFEIGACKLVVEMQGYIWHFVQCIQETFVEGSTIDGLNTLLRTIRCIWYSGISRRTLPFAS